MTKSITLKDLFKLYDHKCQDFNTGNTVPIPYIKNDELDCDHKHSLTYAQWKLIMTTIFKYQIMLLMEGIAIKLPQRLGILQIKKYKGTNIDWVEWNKTGKLVQINHIQTGGFKPILKWERKTKYCVLKHKYHWKVTFLRTTWSKVIGALNKNFAIINKYQEV